MNVSFVKCRTVVMLAALLALMWSSAARAQDARTIGGPLRGSMVLGNMYSTRVLGMGGATHAIEGPRSMNPASLGWTEEFDVEVSYQSARYNQGPHASYYYTEVTVPVPVLGGGLKLMGTSLSSDTDDSKMGTDTHVWGREFGFAYGRYLTDRISIGAAGFPSDPSELRTTVTTPGGPLTLTGRAQSRVGSIRAGTLIRVLDGEDECMGINPGKLSVGTTYTHIIDEWKTRGLPPGMDDDDTAYVNVGGVGLAYEPCQYATLAFDYQFGHIGGVAVRDNVDLINFGGEVRPIEWLQLRAGCMDSRFSAGIGVTLPMDFQIDYAYVDGGFEDTSSAFGRALVHALAVSKRF